MSPVFDRMLQNEWKEVKDNKVVINDFNSKTVELAVKYFYEQMPQQITTDEGSDLLRFADKYDVKNLHVSLIFYFVLLFFIMPY